MSTAASIGPDVPAGRLRRLPTPQSEPPYDDDSAADVPLRRRDEASDGTLALSFVLRSGLPAAAATPHLRLVPDLGTIRWSDDDELAASQSPTPTAALPPAEPFAARLLQAVLEVMAGERPAGQLVRWTDAHVYAWLQRRCVAGTPAPVAARARPVIRSLHVSGPADGVSEVCALVRRGDRCHAVALRLEGRGGRWQCTALELG